MTIFAQSEAKLCYETTFGFAAFCLVWLGISAILGLGAPNSPFDPQNGPV